MTDIQELGSWTLPQHGMTFETGKRELGLADLAAHSLWVGDTVGADRKPEANGCTAPLTLVLCLAIGLMREHLRDMLDVSEVSHASLATPAMLGRSFSVRGRILDAPAGGRKVWAELTILADAIEVGSARVELVWRVERRAPLLWTDEIYMAPGVLPA